MEAIILAGGLGVRLSGVISDLPKPMAPIGGRPFLDYILRYLKKNGVERVILSVGYKWEIIQACYGKKFEGIELIYCVESKPLGTGGAIKKAMQYVAGETVFIINGDTFFDVPLKMLVQNFRQESKLMLSLKKMHKFNRYGCVESDEEGLVTAFLEKGYRESGNINGGVYLATNTIFNGYSLQTNFSFEAFMEKNFHKLNVLATTFDGYFIDIGIPDDYARAQSELIPYA